ncbi:hypothetical protein MW887_000149 [Aspergillus wentii]|nr:hypothetical protein MW887_000149 [Aspergillus wentii]
MPELTSPKDSDITGAAKFTTSTLGNTVVGLSRTFGGVTGAATRGIGDTITGATGSAGKPVGDALGSVDTGVEDGAKRVAKGVEDAGQWNIPHGGNQACPLVLREGPGRNHQKGLWGFATDLKTATDRALPSTNKPYAQVAVIAFHCENDEMVKPVEREPLGVFSLTYGFHVESYTIPGANFQGELATKLLNWLGISTKLESLEGDMCCIFDCSTGTIAMSQDGAETLRAAGRGQSPGCHSKTRSGTVEGVAGSR